MASGDCTAPVAALPRSPTQTGSLSRGSDPVEETARLRSTASGDCTLVAESCGSPMIDALRSAASGVWMAPCAAPSPTHTGAASRGPPPVTAALPMAPLSDVIVALPRAPWSIAKTLLIRVSTPNAVSLPESRLRSAPTSSGVSE